MMLASSRINVQLYYPFRSNPRSVFIDSNITTPEINVPWKDPMRSHLIDISNYLCISIQCIFIADSYLRAVFVDWNITTFEITVQWRDPDKHSDLIQSYSVTVKESGGSTRVNISIGRNTSYTSELNFDPGHLYYFEITSVVQLSDPLETIHVETKTEVVVGGLRFYCFIKCTGNTVVFVINLWIHRAVSFIPRCVLSIHSLTNTQCTMYYE